jgi:hypothetical protein
MVKVTLSKKLQECLLIPLRKVEIKDKERKRVGREESKGDGPGRAWENSP